MYGTVARMRIKPGYEAEFERIREEIGVGTAPGQLAVYAYQMDQDSLSRQRQQPGTASALYEAHAGRRTRIE
ncbi:MAG: hypothetical protein KJ064_17075 [Anaerolineae bacterium]|nr:hypothetical protein [Anaerolineae bacterium]